jgi:hypothetical protein
MRSSEISLVPLSNSKFKQLRDRPDIHENPGDSPYLGSASDKLKTKSTVYTGLCDRFDLSDSVQRSAYAALSAKLLSGSEYIRLWEDRVQEAGAMVVYVSYVRTLSIYSTDNDNYDLKDF